MMDVPTERLVAECLGTRFHPNPRVVAECIKEGADICYRDSSRRYPLLHELVLEGLAECVRICFTTAQSIDFTCTGFLKRTVLHCVCEARVSDADTVTLLHHIIDRIQRCPEDTIDWFQKDSDRASFLYVAADNQKLSLVWPLIVDLPPFADEVDPLRVGPFVWRWDWEALGAHQVFFTLRGTDVVEADVPTAQLVRESWRPEPDLQVVQAAVAHGAQLCFQAPGVMLPILHLLMGTGSEECVLACLQSPLPLDFSVPDLLGNTPLHHLFSRRSTAQRVEHILEGVLHRLETHAEDAVDWGRLGRRGSSLLSLAAKSGHLSTAWTVLKKHHVDYFFGPNSVRPLTLTAAIEDKDAHRLSDEDRHCFVVQLSSS